VQDSLPPGNQYAQASIPPIGAHPNEATANVPPIGASPRADTPAIAVAGPSGPGASLAPQVESYDEETYICRANDTMESISEQYYHNKNYERALLLFNRNHPRASDSIRHDPPIIQEGQALFIPPVRILEKQYGAASPETGASRVAAPLAQASASAPKPPSEPVYRVRTNGEGFWDIAQRTLGNGMRWTEISRLNPQYRPEVPVPAGSTLRLPADARVDAENMP
jgi:nucleoid-associated protein YgaU